MVNLGLTCWVRALTVVTALSSSLRMSWECLEKARPHSVSSTPCELRFIRLAPRIVSNSRMVLVTEGWVLPNDLAAALRLPQRITS